MQSEPRSIAEGFRFLESPRWHDRRIWVVDIYDRAIHSFDEDGADGRVEARPPDEPAGIDFDDDGRLLIVQMHTQEILVRDHAGDLRPRVDLSAAPGPINDMAVAPDGSIYVGAVGFEPMSGASIRPGSIMHVSRAGAVSMVADDLLYPNGIAIAPDWTLLVCESFGNRISSFRVSKDGRLAARSTFARFGDVPPTTQVPAALAELDVSPDGCCLDDHGGLWIADPTHNRVIRATTQDGITDEIVVDGGVFACMLGGRNGRTLYLCVAPDADPASRRGARESQLLAVSVRHPRAGRP